MKYFDAFGLTGGHCPCPFLDIGYSVNYCHNLANIDHNSTKDHRFLVNHYQHLHKNDHHLWRFANNSTHNGNCLLNDGDHLKNDTLNRPFFHHHLLHYAHNLTNF